MSAIGINDFLILSFVIVIANLTSWSLASVSTGDASLVSWAVLLYLCFSYQVGVNVGSINYSTSFSEAVISRYDFVNVMNTIFLRNLQSSWTLICWVLLLAVVAVEI